MASGSNQSQAKPASWPCWQLNNTLMCLLRMLLCPQIPRSPEHCIGLSWDRGSRWTDWKTCGLGLVLGVAANTFDLACSWSAQLSTFALNMRLLAWPGRVNRSRGHKTRFTPGQQPEAWESRRLVALGAAP